MDKIEIIFFLMGAVLTLVGILVFRSFTKEPNQKDKKQIPADDNNHIAGLETQAEIPAQRSQEVQALVTTIDSKQRNDDAFVATRSLKEALFNTEETIWGRLKGIFSNETAKKNIEDIEEILYTADLGPKTVQRILTTVEDQLSKSEKNNLESIKSILKNEFTTIFEKSNVIEPSNHIFSHLHLGEIPTVWLVVGVNGVGKTTTIGKLAAHLAKEGKKVLVAAGDTFRAAAESQLKVWTERAQVEIFSPAGVKDPSAVAFDAISKAKAQNYDVVIVDTAGRLHTQQNLMEELKKVKRVMAKVIPNAPHETLIILDANSGQNALIQAKEFHQALQLTGVVLTKMDGTAKGGVAVGLAHELQIPIRLIGVGEKIGDLRAFSTREFVDSIFY